MTWEDIIREANKAIEQLQSFIAEDPVNAATYDKKLAIMQVYKQEAIKWQNKTIQSTLDKVAEDYYEHTGDNARYILAPMHSSSNLDLQKQETSEST